MLNTLLELKFDTPTLIIMLLASGIVFALAMIFFTRKDKNKDDGKKKPKINEKRQAKKQAKRLEESKPVEIKERKVAPKKETKEEKYIKLSNVAIENAYKFITSKANAGEMVVGGIYNKNSKMYLFNPNGNELNVGDVCTILDNENHTRTIAIVLANQMVDKSKIVKELIKIESVLYKNPDPKPVVIPKEALVTTKALEERPLIISKKEEKKEEVKEEVVEPVSDFEYLEYEPEDDEPVSPITEFECEDNKILSKTYEGLLSSLPDDVKAYYSGIKNTLLAYGLKDNIVTNCEKFRLNRDLFVLLEASETALYVYFAIMPECFSNTKYRGIDLTNNPKYEATPFLYIVKTEQRLQWAIELIELLATSNNLEFTELEYVDFGANYPLLDDNELINNGLATLKDKE